MEISKIINQNFDENYSPPTKFNIKTILITMTAAYILIFSKLTKNYSEKLLIYYSILYIISVICCFSMYFKHSMMYYARYAAVLSALPLLFTGYMLGGNVFALFFIIINTSLFIYYDKKFADTINSVILAGLIFFTLVKFYVKVIPFEETFLQLVIILLTFLVCRKVNDFEVEFNSKCINKINIINKLQEDKLTNVNRFNYSVSKKIKVLNSSAETLNENLTASENCLTTAGGVLKSWKNESSFEEIEILKDYAEAFEDAKALFNTAEKMISQTLETSSDILNDISYACSDYEKTHENISSALNRISRFLNDSKNIEITATYKEEISSALHTYDSVKNRELTDALKYLLKYASDFEEILNKISEDKCEIKNASENSMQASLKEYSCLNESRKTLLNHAEKLARIYKEIMEIQKNCSMTDFCRITFIEKKEIFSKNISSGINLAETSVQTIRKNIKDCENIKDCLSELDYIFKQKQKN